MNRESKTDWRKRLAVLLVVFIMVPFLLALGWKINQVDRRRAERREEAVRLETQRRVDVLNALANQSFGPEHWETFSREEQMLIIASYGGLNHEM